MRRASVVVLVLASCGSADDGSPALGNPDAAPTGLALECPYQPYTAGKNQPPYVPLQLASGATFSARIKLPGAPAGTSYPVTVAVGTSDNAATLAGTTTLDAIDGVVELSDLVLDRWGSATIVASSPGSASCTFDVNVRASRYRFASQPADAVAGVTQPPVRVELTDITGAVDTRETRGACWVAMADPSCPSVLAAFGPSYTTPNAGVIAFENVVLTSACAGFRLKLGNCNNEADNRYFSGPLSDPFDITPGPPRVELGVSPVNASVATLEPDNSIAFWSAVPRDQPLTFEALLADEFHNRITQATTFTLTAAPFGTVSQATTTGRTMFSNLTLSPSGYYDVSVTSGSLRASLRLWSSAWEPRIDLVSQYQYGDFWAIAVAADDPDTVYVDMSYGLLVSHDGAQTFSLLSTIQASQILVDPTPGTQTLYANTVASVARSVDGGVTWTSPPTDLQTLLDPITKVVLDPSDRTRLYALAARNLWVSTDSGATWSTSGPVLPGLFDEYWDVALASDGTAFVTGWYGDSTPFLFRSGKHAGKWTSIPVSDWIRYLWIDPYSSRMFASRPSWEPTSHFASSTDGGITWTPHAEDGWTGQVLFFPDHMLASLGSGGKPMILSASTDGGVTWRGPPVANLDPDFSSAARQAVAPSNRSVVYALTGRGVFRSTTGGL